MAFGIQQRRFFVGQLVHRRSTTSSLSSPASSSSSSLSMLLHQQRRWASSSSSTSSGEAGNPVPGAMPSHEDLYARLGLQRGCEKQDIKSNYRKLAKFYHPDNNQNDKAAEENFKRVTEAYEVLSDNDARRRYDSTGRTPNPNEGFGKWGQGTYSYTYSASTVNPVRFYLGLAATTWLLVMLVKWGYQGSFTGNVLTFLTMLTIVTFLGRIVAAAALFYLYAPSQQAQSGNGPRRSASDTSTVVVQTFIPPNPRVRPTRTIRLTAVDPAVRLRCQVEFNLTRRTVVQGSAAAVAAGHDPEIVEQKWTLVSKQGETFVTLPDDLPDDGLMVRAKLLLDGKATHETIVNLS